MRPIWSGVQNNAPIQQKILIFNKSYLFSIVQILKPIQGMQFGLSISDQGWKRHEWFE